MFKILALTTAVFVSVVVLFAGCVMSTVGGFFGALYLTLTLASSVPSLFFPKIEMVLFPFFKLILAVTTPETGLKEKLLSVLPFTFTVMSLFFCTFFTRAFKLVVADELVLLFVGLLIVTSGGLEEDRSQFLLAVSSSSPTSLKALTLIELFPLSKVNELLKTFELES